MQSERKENLFIRNIVLFLLLPLINLKVARQGNFSNKFTSIVNKIQVLCQVYPAIVSFLFPKSGILQRTRKKNKATGGCIVYKSGFDFQAKSQGRKQCNLVLCVSLAIIFSQMTILASDKCATFQTNYGVILSYLSYARFKTLTHVGVNVCIALQLTIPHYIFEGDSNKCLYNHHI